MGSRNYALPLLRGKWAVTDPDWQGDFFSKGLVAISDGGGGACSVAEASTCGLKLLFFLLEIEEGQEIVQHLLVFVFIS